ncbi:hypothetical protein BDP67DRAFT_236933 [Colletotrichum lupini]|nr:hypothetical protein BDP67DRAFT_236933 [Colletotrichum lupini]
MCHHSLWCKVRRELEHRRRGRIGSPRCHRRHLSPSFFDANDTSELLTFLRDGRDPGHVVVIRTKLPTLSLSLSLSLCLVTFTLTLSSRNQGLGGLFEVTGRHSNSSSTNSNGLPIGTARVGSSGSPRLASPSIRWHSIIPTNRSDFSLATLGWSHAPMAPACLALHSSWPSLFLAQQVVPGVFPLVLPILTNSTEYSLDRMFYSLASCQHGKLYRSLPSKSKHSLTLLDSFSVHLRPPKQVPTPRRRTPRKPNQTSAAAASSACTPSAG